MDQSLVAMLAIAVFGLCGVCYWIGIQEGKSRRDPMESDGWLR